MATPGMSERKNREGTQEMVTLGQPVGTTEVRGRAVLMHPTAVLPENVRVQLIRDGVVLEDTQARAGEFRFAGRFPAGNYLLRGLSKDFAGDLAIDLRDESVKDVRLLLQKKKSTAQ